MLHRVRSYRLIMEELGAGALAEFTICMQIQVVQESIGVGEGDKHKQRGNQAFGWMVLHLNL